MAGPRKLARRGAGSAEEEPVPDGEAVGGTTQGESGGDERRRKAEEEGETHRGGAEGPGEDVQYDGETGKEAVVQEREVRGARGDQAAEGVMR